MLGYALLAAAYLHGLTNGKRVTRLQYILAVCLATLYSVSDEFHQSFTPGRSPSIADVLIDAIGAVIGLGLWALIRGYLPSMRKSASP